MNNKIFKTILFFSIMSMIFVGGNVFAASCGLATEQSWGYWDPYPSESLLCSDGNFVSGTMMYNSTDETWFWACSGGEEGSPYVFCNASMIANNGWKVKAPWAYPRTAHTVASSSSKIYAIGGYRLPLEGPYNAIEEYNPSSNVWTAKSHTNSYDRGMAAYVDGYVYFMGGKESIYIDSNKRYRISNDSWAARADMPTARESATTAVVNNKIYVIGGRNSDGVLNTNEEYDPATNTWTTKASMPTKRYVTGAVTVNNKIYVIGGYVPHLPGSTGVNEEYDPATNTWTTKASMPTPRGHVFPVVYNNKIYVIGGYNTILNSWVTVNEVYDPVTDTWVTADSLPQAVSDAVVAVANDKIYVMGGYDGKINLVYDPTSVAVDGVCGSSSGGIFSSELDIVNLCDKGENTEISYNGGLNNTWTWSCTGINEGSTANCSAGAPAPAGTFDSVEYNGSGIGTISVNVTELSVEPTKLQIRWSTENNPPEVEDIKKWVDVSSTGIKTVSMEDLVDGETYYVSVLISANNVLTDLGTKTLTTNNKPVIINGTLNYSVNVSEQVNFTGFSASDADNDLLSYLWSCLPENEGGGTFINSNLANPTYIAPASPIEDECFLYVFDGKEVTWSDIVTVSVTEESNVQCGSSHGGSFTTAPSTNLCLAGTPIFITSNGSWYWTCSSWVQKEEYRPWSGISMSSTGQYQTAVTRWTPISDSEIYISSDYGATWTMVKSTSELGWFDVDVSSTGQYQTAVGLSKIHTSSDYGATWTQRKNDSNNYYKVAISNDGKYQTAGTQDSYDGKVYTSSDYGATWTATLSGTGGHFLGIDISSTGQYQTASETNNIIYTSSDYGATWTATLSGTGSDFYGIGLSSTGQYQTITTENGVIFSSDYGVTWTSNNLDAYLREVDVSDSGQIQVAVGKEIYTSSDYGATWTATLSGTGSDFYGIGLSSTGQYQTAVAYLHKEGSAWIYNGPMYTSNDYETNVSCFAYKTTCGSSSGGSFSSELEITNLCEFGQPSLITINSSTYTWTCTGDDSLPISCSATRLTSEFSCGDNFTDSRDGQTYSTVQIGDYCWMKENLNYAAENSSCYDNNLANCDVYGRLYHHEESLNACPSGWHLASKEEFDSLFSLTADITRDLLATPPAWVGENLTGFSALPAGGWNILETNPYTYLNLGSAAYFWEWFSPFYVWFFGDIGPLECGYSCIYPHDELSGKIRIYWAPPCSSKDIAISARCVKDYNQKPIITNGVLDYSVNVSEQVNFTGFSASDPDEDDLFYRWTCSCSEGAFVDDSVINPTYIAPASPVEDACSLYVFDGTEIVFSDPVTVSVTEESIDGVCATNSEIYSEMPVNRCVSGISINENIGSTSYTWQCQGNNSTVDCSADRISFKNPLDFDVDNTDESCFYCDYYYDSSGVLRKGSLSTSTGRAQPILGFIVNNTKYINYKVRVGSVETTSWLPINNQSIEYTGLMVGEGVTTDIALSNYTLLISYGNGTIGKTYNWYVNLEKQGGGETGWISAGTFDTPKKPYPIVRIATASTNVYLNTDVQYCTTTNTLNRNTDTSECFDICWTGEEDTASLTSSDWKCSVCYDSSGNRTLCSTSNSQFSWFLPLTVGSYQSQTGIDSPNPIFKYTSLIGDENPGLAITGSECAAEGETGTTVPLPTWRETN
ncbi:MAG: FISUMP domain-containing protein [Candidatus Pacebacteria bacterium]|nr:FISUMP domain-containing protein [Candidatus Paceibacterota bacterium]MDD5752740.1 FISUMP domain-containing protein [Candidatus Paceibacterota bacterium]